MDICERKSYFRERKTAGKAHKLAVSPSVLWVHLITKTINYLSLDPHPIVPQGAH